MRKRRAGTAIVQLLVGELERDDKIIHTDWPLVSCRQKMRGEVDRKVAFVVGDYFFENRSEE